MNMLFPSALSIAGSDPSGGAGIQIDLKTFARTGVWGMAVITGLTAQNASKVTGTVAIDPEFVSLQLSTVLEDINPGAIKTGMLANSGIIHAVADTIPPDIPLIIDPVMVSTSGYRLLDEHAVQDMCELLIPISDIITPNIPETQILTNMKIHTEEEMIEAGYKIIDLGARKVLVKGGHGKGDDATDLLISKKEVIRLTHERLPYNVHGSGCSFSAAITGYIASGLNEKASCIKAKEIISNGIRDAVCGKSGVRMINP